MLKSTTGMAHNGGQSTGNIKDAPYTDGFISTLQVARLWTILFSRNLGPTFFSAAPVRDTPLPAEYHQSRAARVRVKWEKRERGSSCQMAIARFLDRTCLALRASGLRLRYTMLKNLINSSPPLECPPGHRLQTRVSELGQQFYILKIGSSNWDQINQDSESRSEYIFLSKFGRKSFG